MELTHLTHVTHLTPTHRRHASHRDTAHTTFGAPALAPGEHLTLLLAACGYSPTEIADERGVAVGDVVADLSRAVERLGAATVREATLIAARTGLLAWSAMPAMPAMPAAGVVRVEAAASTAGSAA